MKPFKMRPLLIALTGALSLHSVTLQAAPGLVDVYQMALIHDATLAKAQANFEASQQLNTQAKSYLLPDIEAGAGVDYVNHSRAGETGSNRTMSATLKQPLFNREAFKRYDQAQSKLEQAYVQLRIEQQSLILRVSEAYLNVLLTQENLRLAQAKEAADKIEWERAQASADVGLASRTDVLQARSSYDLSISDRISAEHNLDIAYEKMTKITGQTLTEIKQFVLGVNIPSAATDDASIEATAESDNLKVLLEQFNSQIASDEVEVKKSGHWFNVNLQARYTDRQFVDYANPRPDNQDTTVSVQFNVPLYKGGRTSSEVTEARFKEQAANIALRDAREQARLDARTQARNIVRGEALIAALREAVKSNEAFLEAAEEGYRVGLRNMLDVLTARSNVFQARRNLAEALNDFVLNQIRLKNTLGALSVDYLRELDQLLVNPTTS
jgi:outer membrane protein